MSLQRGMDPSEPVRAQPVERLAGTREIRPDQRTFILATGTFACPACDAPVSPAGPMAPSEPVSCPYCEHGGLVRDFLSLDAPARPARVTVRVVRAARALRLR